MVTVAMYDLDITFHSSPEYLMFSWLFYLPLKYQNRIKGHEKVRCFGQG